MLPIVVICVVSAKLPSQICEKTKVNSLAEFIALELVSFSFDQESKELVVLIISFSVWLVLLT